MYIPVMSRIRRAFERRFRELLAELGTRDRERGIQWLFTRAAKDAAASNSALSHSLAEENIVLAEKTHRFRRRKGGAHPANLHVFCDAGLGGLARWLRASGCDAHWVQDITDGQLVANAEKIRATIITTDSFLLDRRPIAQRLVRAIWVPPTLTKLEQLRLVRAELDLPDVDSRCMRCGGELVPVDKEAVRDRIPPRTYLWLEEFFECTRCHQLFWQGTHWQRVSNSLRETA